MTATMRALGPPFDAPDFTGGLHDTYKVDYIAPGHCTGEPTFTALQKAFGDRYLYAGLGTELSVRASPHAASNQHGAPVLDEEDSLTYRSLLAHSDDVRDARLARVQ